MNHRGPPPPVRVVTSWAPILIAAFLGSTVFVIALGVAAWWTRDAVRVVAGPSPDDRARDVDGGAPEASSNAPDAGRSSTSVDPTLSARSNDDVGIAHAFVRALSPPLVSCLRDARRRDPGATDRFTLGIVVDADGEVTAATVVATPSPFFTPCAERALALPAAAKDARIVPVEVGSKDGALVIASPRDP